MSQTYILLKIENQSHLLTYDLMFTLPGLIIAPPSSTECYKTRKHLSMKIEITNKYSSHESPIKTLQQKATQALN
jgi:hypothetical protein